MYAKPEFSGELMGDEEEKEYKEKGGGANKNKQKSKAQIVKEQQEREEAKLKQIADLKIKRAQGGVVEETEHQKEEKKLKKAFKDLPVNMNPEGLIEIDKVREPCSMVFIGHVDAGKSTICGNLMYLNGIIDQRTIDKYK